MPPLQNNQLLRRQRFSAISSAFGLKIAAMAKISNRDTCAPAAFIPERAQRWRFVNAINPPDRLRIGICAPQHKVAGIQEAIERAGATLADCRNIRPINPIELPYSKFKT